MQVAFLEKKRINRHPHKERGDMRRQGLEVFYIGFFVFPWRSSRLGGLFLLF
jgi:hypothetical protein